MSGAVMLALGALVVAGPADAGDWRVMSEADLRLTYGPRTEEIESARLRFEPTFSWAKGRDHRAVVTLRGEVDGYDRLEPGRPAQPTRGTANRRLLVGDRADLELREAYWRSRIDDFVISLGKQQIVWGQADGLKVLDVVNPQSFREFVLEAFEDSRIPLWSASVEWQLGSATLQGVWIPDTTYHELPGPEASYFLSARRFMPPAPTVLAPVVLNDPDRPDNALLDSDAGLRLSGFWAGWDLALSYLYHYEDAPRFELRQSPGLVEITPVYNRVHLIGASFANAFGDFTLRGEGGYTFSRALAVDLAPGGDGIAEADSVGYVLGLDWHGLEDTMISLQIFQDIVIDAPDRLIVPEVDSYATLTYRRSFQNERWLVDTRLYANFNDEDVLVRPKVSRQVNDMVDAYVGADLFYGDGDGVFGQFERQSRIVMGLSFGF